MRRACETAERPRRARLRTGRNSFVSITVSDGMFITLCLSAGGPHLTILAPLNRNPVERARRWPIKDVAGLHVERAFMTGALESPMLFLEIDRAGEMRA